jgi:hypothetical protein
MQTSHCYHDNQGEASVVLCHRRKIMVVAILTKSSYWEFYPKGIHSNPSTHPDTQLLFPKNQTTTLTTQH